MRGMGGGQGAGRGGRAIVLIRNLAYNLCEIVTYRPVTSGESENQRDILDLVVVKSKKEGQGQLQQFEADVLRTSKLGNPSID